MPNPTDLPSHILLNVFGFLSLRDVRALKTVQKVKKTTEEQFECTVSSLEVCLLDLTKLLQLFIEKGDTAKIRKYFNNLLHFGVRKPLLLARQLEKIAMQINQPKICQALTTYLVDQLKEQIRNPSQDWNLIAEQATPELAERCLTILVPENITGFRINSALVTKFAAQASSESIIKKLKKLLSLLEAPKQKAKVEKDEKKPKDPEELKYANRSIRIGACNAIEALAPALPPFAAAAYFKQTLELKLLNLDEKSTLQALAENITSEAANEHLERYLPYLSHKKDSRVNTAAMIISGIDRWLTADLVIKHWDHLLRFFSNKELLFDNLSIAVTTASKLSKPRHAIMLWNIMYRYLREPSTPDKVSTQKFSELIYLLLSKIPIDPIKQYDEKIFQRLVQLPKNLETWNLIKQACCRLFEKKPEKTIDRWQMIQEYFSKEGINEEKHSTEKDAHKKRNLLRIYFCSVVEALGIHLISTPQITHAWNSVLAIYLDLDQHDKYGEISRAAKTALHALLPRLFRINLSEFVKQRNEAIDDFLKNITIAEQAERHEIREKPLLKKILLKIVIFAPYFNEKQASEIFERLQAPLVELPLYCEVLEILSRSTLPYQQISFYLNATVKMKQKLSDVILNLINRVKPTDAVIVWELAPDLLLASQNFRDDVMSFLARTAGKLPSTFDRDKVNHALAEFIQFQKDKMPENLNPHIRQLQAAVHAIESKREKNEETTKTAVDRKNPIKTEPTKKEAKKTKEMAENKSGVKERKRKAEEKHSDSNSKRRKKNLGPFELGSVLTPSPRPGF